ncbi:glycosyltransferase, group 2 family protein [Streptococcus ictaluri 707-05]|uniref:Glycosyltransferase, group 2 family protein n=2 Tax=Streptococcus ictaluri TaxID=380397 RepID=G5K3V9_9STRE|nr:glycosyltransferase, group 2 family protein [Streptococcus ictaluri 707-05]
MISLKKQSLTSRIICYTSTPNDHISSLCTKYDIPLFTKEGGGIGKDWNNALSFVTTPFATIAHQDDIYLESYAEKVMTIFDRYPDSAIVYSDYSEYRDQKVLPANLNLKIKTTMLNALDIFPHSSFWQLRILAFGNPISCPAVTYNLRLLKDYHFNEALRTSLDWFAWYSISKNYKGRFSYIKEKLMYHRIHEESETTATILDNTRSKEDLMMFELLWPKAIAKGLMYFYKKSQESNG